MISIIIFTLMVVGNQITLNLSQFYECSCINLLTEEDCIPSFCNWDKTQSKCSNKSCDQFNMGDCEGVPNSFNCIWNIETSQCQEFTECSNYSFPITEAIRCYKLIDCQADINSLVNTSTTIKCMQKSNDSSKSISNCNNIPYDNCDWLVADDGSLCVRNKYTQTCETKSITKCSDYETIDECDTQTCYWNNSCITLDCSKLSEKTCSIIFSYDQKQVLLCTWKDNECVDLEPENLKQNQCMSYTVYSYAWNPLSEQCEICEKSNSIGHFITGLILLALGLN